MSNRKQIPKSVRQAVYDKFNGHCAYCGCELEYKDMQIDHIDSVHKAQYYDEDVNDDFSNYFPSCRACNFYKSTFSLEEFRNRIETTLYDNLTKNFNYRLLRKYRIVNEHRHPIRFYFEENVRNEKVDMLNRFCEGGYGFENACSENWDGECDERCPLYGIAGCDHISNFSELNEETLDKCIEIVKPMEKI